MKQPARQVKRVAPLTRTSMAGLLGTGTFQKERGGVSWKTRTGKLNPQWLHQIMMNTKNKIRMSESGNAPELFGRSVAFIGALVVCATLLTGCGGDDEKKVNRELREALGKARFQTLVVSVLVGLGASYMGMRMGQKEPKNQMNDQNRNELWVVRTDRNPPSYRRSPIQDAQILENHRVKRIQRRSETDNF